MRKSFPLLAAAFVVVAFVAQVVTTERATAMAETVEVLTANAGSTLEERIAAAEARIAALEAKHADDPEPDPEPDPAPVAAFVYAPVAPVTGSPVSFEAEPGADSYEWDDATNGAILGSGQSMSYTFVNAGTKQVRLTATNSAGTDTVIQDVVVVASTSDPEPDPEPDPAPEPGAVSRQWVMDNAGLADASLLTPSGSITVTTAGAVIENKDVSGSINVKANDVTIRNVRVRGYHVVGLIRLDAANRNLTVEHCEVEALPNPSNPAQGANGAIIGTSATHMTVRHCEISGYADGIKVEMGTPEQHSLYEYNYIHMHRPSGSDKHLDGIQNSGRSYSTIRYNVIDADTSRGGNAAVFEQAYTGSSCKHIYDNFIEYNWMRGGNYTVFLEGGKTVCGAPISSWIHNYRLIGNTFEGGARYGHYRTINRAETTVQGNVDSAGNPVT